MKDSYSVSSVEETWAVAAQFAKELGPGDVVCLEGDLGAGKTTFVQGLAAALGVSGPVASPTFCIVREYKTAPGSAVPFLVHMDLYRLSGEEDVESTGWDDYIAGGAAVAVEWPDRAGSLVPGNAWRVRFEYSADGDDSRTISFSKPSASAGMV